MRRACLAIALLSALVAAAPAQAVNPPAVPTHGALWGAFPNEPGGVGALQRHVGRRLAVVNRYVPWDSSSWTDIGTYLRGG